MVRKAKGKKVLALLMAAAMAASFSITAMADDTTDTPTANVTGFYAGAGGKPVFLYEYNMPETMAFKYSAPGSGVWDPNTHSYKPGTTSEGGWSSVGGDNWITVKNHFSRPRAAGCGLVLPTITSFCLRRWARITPMPPRRG